jgi:hypothetical protein
MRMTSFLEIGNTLARWVGGTGGADGSRPPWGDGSCNRSLATQLYGASWADVDGDELVWLLPNLADQNAPDRSAVLKGLLLQAIERELRALGGNISQNDFVVSAIASGGTVPWNESGLLADLISSPHSTLPSRHSASNASRDASGPKPRARCTRDVMGDWSVVSRLSVVECLAAALRDTIRQATGREGRSLLMSADAVVVGLSSGFNAGYLDPAHAADHDRLAVAAWLGQLVRRHQAWLPAHLAPSLLDEIKSKPQDDSGGLIQQAASHSVGLVELRVLASGAVRQRSAKLVRLQSKGLRNAPTWRPWNSSLHLRVMASLGWNQPSLPEGSHDAA